MPSVISTTRPPGRRIEQRQRVVAGDQVGLDRQAQQAQAVVQVVLPQLGLPVEQQLAAPDVVDQHVEAAVVGVDPLDQRRSPDPARGGRPSGRRPRRRRPRSARPSPRSSRAGCTRRAPSACCGRWRTPWRRPGPAPLRWRGRRPASLPPPARPSPSTDRSSPFLLASTSTPPSTSAPPASCTALSASPNTRNASTTVVTGSAVERIDADVGPTRARPAKNRPTAATVEITAMPGQPAEPGGAHVARVQIAVGDAAQRERRRPRRCTRARSAGAGRRAPRLPSELRM